MDILKIIKESDLTNKFTDEELAAIVEIAVAEEYERDAILIREDAIDRDIYLIHSGWVLIEAQRSSTSKEAVKLEVLKTKGIVGEVSFIDGSRRTANAVARDKVSCLRLPYDNLKELMDQNHNIGYKIMGNLGVILCERIRNANFEIRNNLLW